MKDLFKVNTKTIVATGLGAAIFTLLFMYVKVPSPVPETSFQTAYGVSALFATLFGPIAGALISFIGHALSDAIQYGSPWWSWVIASGVSGFIFGFAFKRTRVEEGEFKGKDIITFNIIQILGNVIAWVVILLYHVHIESSSFLLFLLLHCLDRTLYCQQRTDLSSC